MRNVVGNGDVGMWWGMAVWNMVDNFDVECSAERLREIGWITLTWNAPENGYVRYGGEL